MLVSNILNRAFMKGEENNSTTLPVLRFSETGILHIRTGSLSFPHSVHSICGKPTVNFRSFFEEVIRTARISYQGNTYRQHYHRFKYALRCFLFFRCTSAWLALLQKPLFKPIVRRNPRIHLKLQRPYLLHGLKARDKLAVLNQHFCFINDVMSSCRLEKVCSPRGFLLCEFSPRTDHLLRLSLQAGVHEKEGELTLLLENVHQQVTIKTLTFCVTAWGEESNEIFIGGIQGIRSEQSREIVVNATRAMFGMRPKGLLLHVLRKLAIRWNIQRIRGVGNSRHVSRGRLKEIGSSANFDVFWLESGGETESDGIYTIPLEEAEKDLSPLKPSKRAMYRKRMVMLQAIDEAVCGHGWTTRDVSPQKRARDQ